MIPSRPTLRQIKFAAFYTRTKDGVLSARMAGYRGGDELLARAARNNLRKRHVQALVADERKRVAGSPTAKVFDNGLVAGLESALEKGRELLIAGATTQEEADVRA